VRAVLFGLWLLTPVALAWGAEEHLEIRAAQLELKLARARLQAAGRDYEGHRYRAVQNVNQALEEIRQALKDVRAAAEKPPDDD
jgi:hypothetical protein